jgi:hypothetical protein
LIAEITVGETTLERTDVKKQGNRNLGEIAPACRLEDGTAGIEPQPKVETFTAADLLAMELPEPHWAIPGILPAGLSLLGGKPKLGKSWLVLNASVAIATGGIALGKIAVEGGDVLYLSLEDTKRRLKSRLEILLRVQPGELPSRLTLAREWPRQDKGGLEAICAWLEEHVEARLIVVDTWGKFRPPKFRGIDPYEEDYRHASELKKIADDYKVAVWTVTHCRKMGAVDPLEEIAGSVGLTGCADAIQVLRRERGQADATLHVTGRDVEEQELALKWHADSALWSIVGEAQEYRMSKERGDVRAVLIQAGKPLTPGQVARLLGKNPNATKTLLWRMAQDGQLHAFGDGTYATISTPRNPSNSSNSSNPSNYRNRANGGPVAAPQEVEQPASNRHDETETPWD